MNPWWSLSLNLSWCFSPWDYDPAELSPGPSQEREPWGRSWVLSKGFQIPTWSRQLSTTASAWILCTCALHACWRTFSHMRRSKCTPFYWPVSHVICNGEPPLPHPESPDNGHFKSLAERQSFLPTCHLRPGGRILPGSVLAQLLEFRCRCPPFTTTPKELITRFHRFSVWSQKV